MDKALEVAFDSANYLNTLRNQRDLLEQWASVHLQYAHGGGLFKINPELISMIRTFIDVGRNNCILLDCTNTPIEVLDLSVFLENIVEKYFEVTNEYYAEYTKLTNQRFVKDLVGCNEES